MKITYNFNDEKTERNTNNYVVLEKLTIKEKIIWTFRIWFGYKTELKTKIKTQISGDELHESTF